ncbi:hypothetical protein [Geodermatophilus sp. FMUSA9-8]|uniref:hypothetical protein n=1 Tax=Geodermatophilus sp. FMUSA9-8 TaxID=3120155 RepID=UPI0030094EBE
MSRDASLPRPLRKVEYEIVTITKSAEKGWRDMLATARNATVDAWEQLTAAPEEQSPRQYPLKGDLSTGTYQGTAYTRWQYKLTDGGRIWYFVDRTTAGKHAGRVLIHDVSPGHPKSSERVRGRR